MRYIQAVVTAQLKITHKKKLKRKVSYVILLE